MPLILLSDGPKQPYSVGISWTHFTGEETEAQRCNRTCPNSCSYKVWWSWDLNLGWFDAQSPCHISWLWLDLESLLGPPWSFYR